MISGVKTLLPRALERIASQGVLLALVLAWTPLASSAAPGFDLASLMTELAKVRSGDATFVEQRFVRTLDAPLVSRGTLSFSAPDRFSRQTLQPRSESVSVQGNSVTVTRAGRSRNFTLDAAPELVGVIEAVRGTLTGNEAVIRRYFETQVEGSAAAWTLTLTPLESRLGQQVRQIKLAGEGSLVKLIDMRLTDGDYSTMAIVPTPASGASPSPLASPDVPKAPPR